MMGYGGSKEKRRKKCRQRRSRVNVIAVWYAVLLIYTHVLRTILLHWLLFCCCYCSWEQWRVANWTEVSWIVISISLALYLCIWISLPKNIIHVLWAYRPLLWHLRLLLLLLLFFAFSSLFAFYFILSTQHKRF